MVKNGYKHNELCAGLVIEYFSLNLQQILFGFNQHNCLVVKGGN